MDNVIALLDPGATANGDSITRDAVESAGLTCEDIDPETWYGAGVAIFTQAVYAHVSLGVRVAQVRLLVAETDNLFHMILCVQTLHLLMLNMNFVHLPVRVDSREQADQPGELVPNVPLESASQLCIALKVDFLECVSRLVNDPCAETIICLSWLLTSFPKGRDNFYSLSSIGSWTAKKITSTSCCKPSPAHLCRICGVRIR